MKPALIALPLFLVAACGGSSPNPVVPTEASFRAIDDALRLACSGAAYQLAAQTGKDVREIVAKTCNVEAFTRDIREQLLRKAAEQSSGEPVPGPLEPSPYE